VSLRKFRRRAVELFAGSTILAGSAFAADPGPNIVFILADDLGWTDINCRTGAFEGYIADPDDHSWKYDSTYHDTPNIARLRAAGMRFTQAYAACPVCVPTRACIITGKYPSRFNMAGPSPEIDRQYRTADQLVSAFTRPQLPHEETTIAEALKPGPGNPTDPKNYVSCFVGKWQLCHSHTKTENYYLSYPSRDAYWPSVPENGFDFSIHSYGIRRIDGAYWEGAGDQYPDCYDLQELPGMAGDFFDPTTLWGDPDRNNPNEYLTDSYTRKTEQFLERVADPKDSLYRRPFFLYLSHHAVHTPIQSKENYKAYFAATKGKPKRHNNPDYAAMLKSLDDSVGRIMDKLKALNIWDNTVIIFTSDNGGGSASISNSPLRGGKGGIYEGGIRVPMIVCWPGHTPPNSTCDVPVFSADFFPTFLDIAGIKTDQVEEAYKEFDKTTIDGTSLVPLLQDPKARITRPNDAIFWHYPMAGIPRTAVRRNHYKLIKSYGDNRYNWDDPNHFDHNTGQLKYNAPGTFELYNLVDNISEDTKYNLYTDRKGHPFYEESRYLKSLVENWLANINAGMLRPKVRIGSKFYRQIQSAIDDAAQGAEIILSPGVHLERIKISNKNITLRSIDPNDPEIVANTVIHGANAGTVVTFGGDETSKCALRGLTITGGSIPAAHWRFDEATGKAAYDSIGHSQAILHGAIWTSSKIGGALAFDGQDDYVDCGNIRALNPLRHSYSLSLRVSFDNFNRDMILLSKRKDNNNFFELSYKTDSSRTDTGFLDFTGRANRKNLIQIRTTKFALSGKGWLHVAVAADRTRNDGGRIYLNGVVVPLQKKKLDKWGGFLAPDANLLIGNNASGSMPFYGKIDELMIYNWALTPDQVKTLAAGQSLNGGGISGNNTHATIDKCIIRGNSAYEGGGIHRCNGLISDCQIVGNSATQAGGALAHCSGTIVNSVITDNYSKKSGGGLYDCDGGNIKNCIVAYNIADAGAGLNDCASEIRNCIIWENATWQKKTNQLYNCVNPNYSFIQGWTSGGKGNINSKPFFRNSYEFFDMTVKDADTFSFFSLKVRDAGLYKVGDVIELNNDGVRRTVTGTVKNNDDVDVVKFHPPISPPSASGMLFYNWGRNAPNVIEDYRLKPTSPCIPKGIATSSMFQVPFALN